MSWRQCRILLELAEMYCVADNNSAISCDSFHISHQYLMAPSSPWTCPMTGWWRRSSPKVALMCARCGSCHPGATGVEQFVMPCRRMEFLSPMIPQCKLYNCSCFSKLQGASIATTQQAQGSCKKTCHQLPKSGFFQHHYLEHLRLECLPLLFVKIGMPMEVFSPPFQVGKRVRRTVWFRKTPCKSIKIHFQQTVVMFVDRLSLLSTQSESVPHVVLVWSLSQCGCQVVCWEICGDSSQHRHVEKNEIEDNTSHPNWLCSWDPPCLN